jgi:hypothetical protein
MSSTPPVRGREVRALGLPLPPGRMPPLRAGRPLKRWRHVGVYGPELMLCVGHARVAGLPRRWWAVALPDGTLHEGSAGVRLAPGSVRVGDGGARIELELDEQEGVEVVSPHGRSYIWTRKQADVRARGSVSVGRRSWELDGRDAFIDESAGYHARHTRWRWSAGIGRAVSGERLAWNPPALRELRRRPAGRASARVGVRGDGVARRALVSPRAVPHPAATARVAVPPQ